MRWGRAYYPTDGAPSRTYLGWSAGCRRVDGTGDTVGGGDVARRDLLDQNPRWVSVSVVLLGASGLLGAELPQI